MNTTTTRSTTAPDDVLPAPARDDDPGLAAAVLQPFRDAWIAARTRLALLVALKSDAGEVSIETYRGNVVLYGDVACAAARNAAERAVQALGVGVSNRLRIRGAHALRPGASDAELRTAVSGRLRDARGLRGSIVTVENVYDGVVRLTGLARDAHTVAEAFEIAVHVPGVRRVINDVVPYRPTAADDDADAA